jgi:ABC-type Zn uptake system ZnuABC Zn-binding protein ZnuA
VRLNALARPLSLLVGFGLLAAACGGGQAVADNDDRLRVVVDFSVVADFVASVGGDRVQVTTLVPLGGDPHAYEPRPSDARAVTDADLIIKHGLGLSPWMRPLVANASGPVLRVADVVADDAVRGGDGLLDPHLWLVPPLALAYVETIAAVLIEADPVGADSYEQGAREYAQRLRALDDELQAAFATIPEKQRLLVTPHDAYRYFAEHFGLQVLGTLVGVTSEEEPSARRIRDLVDAVRESEAPAIFTESTVPSRPIERVALEASVEVAGPIYGDSVGAEGSGADDYLSMMRTNAVTIVEALGGDSRSLHGTDP